MEGGKKGGFEKEDERDVPLIFLLESALLSSLHRAVASIAKLPNTRAPATILRVEDLT